MREYQELLKDPRWQKRRLEIMSRDGFCCSVCGCGLNDGTPLNVHHISYKPNTAPWNYNDSDLITLCSKCHQKVHDNKVTLPKNKESRDSIVYFKHLFKNDNLTPNEGIVYSVLLLHSLVKNNVFYERDTFCINRAKDYLIQNGESLPYFSLKIKELMCKTEITFPTIKKILNSLRTKGYLDDSCIMCSVSLLKEGYFKIPKGTGVKGRQLIFYSFLLDRSKKYRGIIDTWAYRFKDLCGVDADDAYFMIKQLKKKGLVERLDDGRLKVYKK